jgi:hypothetical protein
METIHFKDQKEIVHTAFDTLCKKTDCFIVFCNANGVWTFKNDHQVHEYLSTTHVKQLCIKKIELLSHQRSYMYVTHETSDSQTTVS